MKTTLFLRNGHCPYCFVIQTDNELEFTELFGLISMGKSYTIARIHCYWSEVKSMFLGFKWINEHGILASDHEILDVLSKKHTEIGQVIDRIRGFMSENGVNLDDIFRTLTYKKVHNLNHVGIFLLGMKGEIMTGPEIYNAYLKSKQMSHLPKRAFSLQVTAHGYKSRLSSRNGIIGRYYHL